MIYKIMVMLHVLGACVWIGGLAALMYTTLPAALRRTDPERVIEVARGFGRLGLGALVVQLLTGFWLAHRWIADWSRVISEPTPQTHLILSKITLLGMTVALAGFTYHHALPRIAEGRLRHFAVLSVLTAVLAILMLAIGVGIRTGGIL